MCNYGKRIKKKRSKKKWKKCQRYTKLSKEKANDYETVLTIIVVLLVFFVILYILTGIFITKDIKWFDKKDTTTDNVSTISNKILGVDSLRQSEEEYYVYYYDTTNENSDVTSTINSLTTKVYKVDLHDAFNANIVGDPSGVVSDISELKVADPTVIKVVNSTITEYYTGVEQITTTLK